MKKILLVENVNKRYVRAKYELLPDFNDVIEICEYVPRSPDDSKYNLVLYKAILLHKNYFENDVRVIDQVVNFIKQKRIPFVLFSGESPNSRPDLISHNDFYRNLSYFLEYYRDKQIIEFKILLYGKYFNINEILSIREEILIEFINKKYYDPLDLSNTQYDNLKNLLVRMGYDQEQVSKSIHNLTNSNKYGSIEEFTTRLNILVEKFIKGNR